MGDASEMDGGDLDGGSDAGCVCGANSSCGASACECDEGFDDCNGDASDGCEAALDTLTDCGGCGMACSPAMGMGTCSTGTCELMGCTELYDDCNTSDEDGCETALTTLTDCGGCESPCAPADATGDCSTGTCEIADCTDGFDDCNTSADDGCEVELNTLTDCGGCDAPCALDNGTASCESGSCELIRCEDGYVDCNGDAADGCELPTTTVAVTPWQSPTSTVAPNGFTNPQNMFASDDVFATAPHQSGCRCPFFYLSGDDGGSWTSPQIIGPFSTSSGVVTVGSASDTWGRVWMPSELGVNFRAKIANPSTLIEQGFDGFDFSAVPANATILGFQVSLEAYGDEGFTEETYDHLQIRVHYSFTSVCVD